MEVKNGVVVWSSKIVIKLATVIFNKENIFKPALYDHDLKKKNFFWSFGAHNYENIRG